MTPILFQEEKIECFEWPNSRQESNPTEMLQTNLKFASYFKNRRCHVTIAGVDSDDTELQYGAPQGSVIGPLSFTMYVRPIGDILRKHGVKFHMYADDIYRYFFLILIPRFLDMLNHTALTKLKNCISEVQRWMFANKLKLNQDKTENFLNDCFSESSLFIEQYTWS